MVKSCAAFNCTNRFEKYTAVKFHRFPLLKKDLCKHWGYWLNFTANESSYICGNHFKKEDYIFSDSNRLKPSAVPSIFEFPAHLNKSETSSTSKLKEPFHRVEVPLSKYQALEPTPCSFTNSKFTNKGRVEGTAEAEKSENQITSAKIKKKRRLVH